MLWTVEFLREAVADLAKLDRPVRARVLKRIKWLAESFDTLTPAVLTGEFRDFYKLRAGDWRVFYKVDWRGFRITVYYIDRRDKAYKLD